MQSPKAGRYYRSQERVSPELQPCSDDKKRRDGFRNVEDRSAVGRWGVSVQEEVMLFCPGLFSPLEIFALVPIKTV